MDELIKQKKFKEIDLQDPFFDTLKEDYNGFAKWYARKEEEDAFVLEDERGIQAFLYLKRENGKVNDVKPELEEANRLKLGTFKINPHGTRLGERFIKKAFDYAIHLDVDELYVTVFPKHTALVNIFKKYGFYKHGVKQSEDGIEDVYVKSLQFVEKDIHLAYPKIHTENANKYVLSIYPDYHTRLFPDSILHNENFDIIEDVSHTNSIHKIYICKMKQVQRLRKGDLIVIYRTKDRDPAWYRSVATSVCVVEETRKKTDFNNMDEYLDYCHHYSVFTEDELKGFFRSWDHLYIIKMTYNIAFRKRLTRQRLIQEVGLESRYWGFFDITDHEFDMLLRIGDVDESLIVD